MRATHNQQTHKNNKSGCRATCVLAGAARALHDTRHPKTKEEEEEQRVVLDGGGARLADAATRHRLTPTQTKKKKKRTTSEQNKQPRTQTIQKTSTRQSTSHRHHTLPSMRGKTPIQQ